jgi:mono/diheme cytochrome c family protein
MRILAFIIFLFAVSAGVAQQKQQLRSGDAERGRYLTEQVAMCVQCHTPRDANGELIRSRLFGGAPIPVSKPAQWNTWAEFAPRIAGLPQYTEEQMVRLLMTGIGREGKPLRAPMPTFKLTKQDAEDVVAYLKSVE